METRSAPSNRAGAEPPWRQKDMPDLLAPQSLDGLRYHHAPTVHSDDAREVRPERTGPVSGHLPVTHCIRGVAASLRLAATIVALVAAGGASAQVPEGAAEPDVPEKVGKELRALRITGAAPSIDGVLDDEVWAAAMAIEDFLQGEPDNMASPTDRTVVRVAYDDGSLYVAVRAYASDPASVTAGLGRRDNFPPSDRVSVYLDPRHDHLTGYVFQVNPSGIEGDFTLFDDTGASFDYDGVWEVETRIDAEGWTAEFRIPLSQMRFQVPPGGPAIWGFNVNREVFQRGEDASWVAAPRGAVGNVSRFGHLVFDEPITPPRRLEVAPFVLSRSEHPAIGSSSQEVDGGIDLRYGVGSSAVLSATLNPDFGQVEQDPAVLNLSVFETQFQEKRPFFLEDSRIFVPPYGQLPVFYSPRIGRTPGRIPLEEGDALVSRPDRTTLLGAAKLTASTGDWTYGVLSALTDREYAVVDHATEGPGGETSTSRLRRLIEPRTSYNVGRVQRNILGGSSNVGLIGTAVVRDGYDDAFTGGADGVIRWSQNRFFLNNFWVRTRAPMAGVMRSGFGGATNFGYSSRNFGLNAHFDHFSRYFRNSDLGFLTSRPNKTNVNGGFLLIRPDPWRAFRRVQFGLFGNRTWNGDGLVTQRLVGTNVFTQFANFWDMGGGVEYDFEVLSDLNTRGGPPIVVPANLGGFMFVNTDSRRSWRVFLNANWMEDVEGGRNRGLSVDLSLQPSARVQASLRAGYNWGTDIAQWITNRDVTGDGEVDHVFGRLHRDVIDVTARGTFAFTRDMTLEVFLQPFVSVGHYEDIRRLARPSSFEFEPVTLPYDPDFTNRSLRSNVVLRWEYSSGSTLYLVWQSSGADRSDPGVFDAWDDLGGAFGSDRDDILMLKTTYWMSF